MKAYWASDRMGSMVWEMHGDEDMRTGGLEERRSRGEKDRVFQHSTAQHSTLNPSRAARPSGSRNFQCCGMH